MTKSQKPKAKGRAANRFRGSAGASPHRSVVAKEPLTRDGVGKGEEGRQPPATKRRRSRSGAGPTGIASVDRVGRICLGRRPGYVKGKR